MKFTGLIIGITSQKQEVLYNSKMVSKWFTKASVTVSGGLQHLVRLGCFPKENCF